MENGESSYRRFLAGDDSAMTELIDEYADGLILYLNTIMCDLRASEEAAEDTFVKLVTKKPRFSGKSSFKTWLYSVGRNTALDRMRHEARERTLPLDAIAEMAGDAEVEREYLREEKKIELRCAMKRLKPEYGQVLWLIYFEEQSASEIAKIMKKSRNAVEQLATRARRALRAELEKEGADFDRSR